MINKSSEQRTPVWLQLSVVDGQVQLSLRLPRRWVVAGLVLLTTWWGGPELSHLLQQGL